MATQKKWRKLNKRIEENKLHIDKKIRERIKKEIKRSSDNPGLHIEDTDDGMSIDFYGYVNVTVHLTNDHMLNIIDNHFEIDSYTWFDDLQEGALNAISTEGDAYHDDIDGVTDPRICETCGHQEDVGAIDITYRTENIPVEPIMNRVKRLHKQHDADLIAEANEITKSKGG